MAKKVRSHPNIQVPIVAEDLPSSRGQSQRPIPTAEDLSTLLANARLHLQDALVAVGYTRSQVAQILAETGPDPSLPEPINDERPSTTLRWHQSRAREMLGYAFQCEQAYREQRWADSVKAAYLLGATEGGLFARETDRMSQQKGARETAKTRSAVWPQILAAADSIWELSNPKNRPTVDGLHQDVMKIPGMPQRKLSRFSARWSEHRAKKDSK